MYRCGVEGGCVWKVALQLLLSAAKSTAAGLAKWAADGQKNMMLLCVDVLRTPLNHTS